MAKVSSVCTPENSQPVILIVLSDTAFHATEGDPSNLKLCPRGAWEDRLLVEDALWTSRS